MSKSIKLEKITLWTSIPLYGAKDTTVSAMDYMMDTLDNNIGECSILDYTTEDYQMVPTERK